LFDFEILTPSNIQEDEVKLEGLRPIAGPRADVLILGSFPGEMSLRKQEYYAHPRNLFWDIMGCIAGAGRDKDYPSRIEQLKNSGICLWDVLKSCNRDGSLDTRIRNGQVNHFNSFLSRHQVRVIFFNGKKSAEAFNRNVVPGLTLSIESHALPSTSPAHTGMTKEEKLRRWCLVKEYL
jgi:TDG/mug DNA glycosylase family protein